MDVNLIGKKSKDKAFGNERDSYLFINVLLLLPIFNIYNFYYVVN